MDPSYTLIPVLQTPEIDPGDIVEVDFYISAIGDIDKNRLHIVYAYDDLFAEDVGFLSPGVKGGVDESGRQGIIPKEDGDDITWDLSSTGTQISLPSWFFLDMPSEHTKSGGLAGLEGHAEAYPQKVSEVRYGDFAPLEMKFNTTTEAAPGNYTITIIFSYESNGELFTDREEVQFHINTFREQYEPIPTTIAVIAGIAAVLSLVYQSGIIELLFRILTAVI